MVGLDEKVSIAYRECAQKFSQQSLIPISVRRFGNQYFPSPQLAELFDTLSSSLGSGLVLEKEFDSYVTKKLSSDEKKTVVAFETSQAIVKKLSVLAGYQPNGDVQEPVLSSTTVVDSLIDQFSVEYKNLMSDRHIRSDTEATRFALDFFNGVRNALHNKLPSYELSENLFGEVLEQKVMHNNGSSHELWKPYSSNITFEDVIGLDYQKKALMIQLVNPLLKPKQWAAIKRCPEKTQDYRNFLLIGPSGTGKTHIAKATAGQLDIPFLKVKGPDFVQSLLGEGKNKLAKLYEQASEYDACIVYIDEAEDILRDRNARQSELKGDVISQLLCELGGVDARSSIATLFSTNMQYKQIDSAVRSRIPAENVIVFPPLDRATQKKVFQYHVDLFHHDNFSSEQYLQLSELLYDSGNTHNISQIAISAAQRALHEDRTLVSYDDLHAAVLASSRSGDAYEF